MTRAALFAALAGAAFAAGAAEVRVLPPDPRPGEAFAVVAAFDFTTAPCGYQSGSSERSGNALRITAHTGTGSGGNSGGCRAGTLVDGLPAGTYTTSVEYAGRPVLSAGTIVVQGAAPAEPAFRNLDGNWFDPAEPGWGVNLVQGDSGKLFAIWFMHVPDTEAVRSRPQWLVVSDGRWITPTLYRGVAAVTRGSAGNLTLDGTKLLVASVGYVEIEFTGNDQARFRGRIATDAGALVWVDRSANLRRFAF